MEIPGYRDLTPVGSGEFDDRFDAVAEATGALVTISVLRGSADERLERRLERERTAAARIGDHPNVVGVVEAGLTPDGVPFVARQRSAGGTLAARLADGPLPLDQVVVLATGLAAGLQAAHDAGVLHRDLTPDVVELAEDGTPRLAGFGVAAMEGDQATAALSFTPVHTAPEVVEGKQPTEATDVYQLGSVLYTALAGHPPFGTRQDGTMTVLNRILSAPLPPIDRPDVPAAATAAIAAAMAKDPAERTPDPTALASALAAAAGGPAAAAPAPPVSAPEVAPPPTAEAAAPPPPAPSAPPPPPAPDTAAPPPPAPPPPQPPAPTAQPAAPTTAATAAPDQAVETSGGGAGGRTIWLVLLAVVVAVAVAVVLLLVL